MFFKSHYIPIKGEELTICWCSSYIVVPNGGEEVVTVDNVEEYVSATLDFVLDRGIRRQMNAFRKGFNAVFPIERLGSFAPEEVQF